MDDQKADRSIDRRRFLHSAAAGAGVALVPAVWTQASDDKADDINVALLGAGVQGQVLMNTCLKIPGVRFKAVCDIWTAFNQKRVSRILTAYRHEHNVYVDFKEMLDKEKDLDAVIIATPDFWHAEHTVASLKAGLHVYCEKEMSNTLEGARKMVLTAKRAGKLLQIGHQRRSNPRYIFCYENLIKGARLLGQIIAVNGQWNRSAREPLGWPKNAPIEQATLEKYGYESMHHFRNWRWYRGLGGGPIVDLGSHQIDVYNWFLDALPKTVTASGRTNYYDKKTHEWYDTVMAIYEYATALGPVSAYYQTVSANSSGGYFETFMGDEATLLISESTQIGEVYREPRIAPDLWTKWVNMGYLKAPRQITPSKHKPALPMYGDETPPPFKLPRYKLTVQMDKPYHQPHLENFFEAIRGGARLTCPAEVGYETAVAVLKVNDAVEAARKLEFQPDEFAV
ncbi:MAG: Gfo/Idh/MocA family oxidoreductase [Phycisphaerales bacterium]|nr:MAG: Gfo/Idh/MocA family oxidoreductase [Phycisphaerales bacterium]